MNKSVEKAVRYIKSLTRLSDAVNRSFSHVDVYKNPYDLAECAIHSVMALKEISEARKYAKTMIFHKTLKECLEHECDWTQDMVGLCVGEFKRHPVIEYQIVKQKVLDTSFSEQEKAFIESLYSE